MKIMHTKPCSECPWRRTSPAGWLGGHETEAYAAPVRHGTMVPCHKKGNRAYCAGAAISMKNSCTRPRDPDMAAELEKVQESDDVFRFPTEFEKHHDNGVFAKTRKGAKR